ncbi:MAG: extracellular solute-binding protein [Dehalococcoidia bacterium]
MGPGQPLQRPYDWGTTGILYNTRAAARPTAWRAFAQHSDASRVGLDSDWLVTLGLTLKSLGASLNADDEGPLAAAADDIARLRAAGAPLMDSVDLRQAMIDGRLDMAVAYSGDAAVALAANPDLAWVIPDEGADLYMDVAAIVAASAHRDEAHQLVNFFMRPDIQARITAFTGYGNPNRESARLGLNADDLIHGEIAAAAIDRLEPWQVMDPTRQASWNRAWARAEAHPLTAR